MAKLNIDNEEWLIEEGILKVYRGNSKDITIPEGVVEIADNAFLHCLIESVILPNSLKKIGNYAFFDNHIKKLIIPESVEEIGYEAFCYNKISKLTFLSSLKHMGPLAFICIELEVLKIPPQFNFFDNFALSEVKRIVFTSMPNPNECGKITELMKEYPDIDFVYEDLTTTINLKTDLALYIDNEE